MYLQLSEGYTAPPMYYMSERRKRTTHVKGYRRAANRVPAHTRSLSEEAGVDDNPYIFIPDVTGQNQGYMVREDNLDDLSNAEWNQLMFEVAPYQPQVQQGMSENMFLADRAARKAKRAAKQAAKEEKKAAKTEIKKARAEKIRSGGGGGSGILDGISGALGSVLGGVFGITPAAGQTPGGAPADTESFWDKEIFGIPTKIAVPVGIAAAVGTGYYITRKRRRK